MSQLNVYTIKNRSGKGGISLPLGADSAGIVTATSLDSRQLIGDVNVGGALTITGNMTVEGTQTIINTSSLEVADKTVGVGSTSNPSDASANGAGLVVYGSTEKSLKWGTSGHKWTLEGGGLESSGINVTGVTTSTNVSVGQSVTATTFYGDGANLSNLPATAGAFTATASGAIAANAPTIINEDGTVSVPAVIAITSGTQTEFATGEASSMHVAYDPTNKKVVVVFQDKDDSNRGKACAGTVDASNKSITWGSLLTIATSTNNFQWCRIAATGSGGRLFVVWRNPANNRACSCIVTTSASDNSLTRNSSNQGTGTVISNENPYSGQSCVDIAWDTVNDCGIFVYCDTNRYPRYRRVTIDGSGDPAGTGSESSYGTSNDGQETAVAINSGVDCFIATYSSVYGNLGGTRLYNLQNDTPTNTGHQEITGSSWGRVGSVAYSPKHDIYMVGGIYDSRFAGQLIYIRNSTPQNNGATKPFGVSGRAFFDDTTAGTYSTGFPVSIQYNILRDCFYGTSRSSNPAGAWYGQVQYSSTVGLSTFVGTPVEVKTGNTHYPSVTYDSDNGYAIFTYRDSNAGDDGQGLVVTSAYNTLTAKNWVGFSADTYSDGDTATVNVMGGLTTQTGLTTLSDYYVHNTGIVTASYSAGFAYTGVIGRALNSTQLLINSPINTFG